MIYRRSKMNYWLLFITFTAVNLDFFLIMLFLLQRYRVHEVALGYTLGVALLVTVSFFTGRALALFLPEWLLGLLGILPIYMAIRDNDEAVTTNGQQSPVLATLVTYLAVCSGCNLSIFLPVLADLSYQAFILALLFVVALAVVAVGLVKGIGELPIIKRVLEKYSELLMKVIYVGIGLYIFYDSGLVHHLLALL